MLDVLKQHNVLTFITDSSWFTVTRAYASPKCINNSGILPIIASTCVSRTVRIYWWRHLCRGRLPPLIEGDRGDRRGVRASWMAGILYFPWKMTHFDVCCLLSLYLFVLFLDDSCDFVIRLDRFEARRSSSCPCASLAFAFSFQPNCHLCRFFARLNRNEIFPQGRFFLRVCFGFLHSSYPATATAMWCTDSVNIGRISLGIFANLLPVWSIFGWTSGQSVCCFSFLRKSTDDCHYKWLVLHGWS